MLIFVDVAAVCLDVKTEVWKVKGKDIQAFVATNGRGSVLAGHVERAFVTCNWKSYWALKGTPTAHVKCGGGEIKQLAK